MPSTATAVSDAQKSKVWADHHAGQPTRVPVTLSTNPRVVILNPDWNPGGIDFEQTMTDPLTHIRVSLQHELYRQRVIHRFCDHPTELPDVWLVDLMVYNIYEAAYFGAPIKYYPDQVPDTEPYLTEDNREAVFEVDIDRPMDNPFVRHWLDFWSQMEHICRDMTFEGRPVKLNPWAQCGTDGPVTVAMNLRGADFMIDLIADTDYSDRLMRFIVDGGIKRRQWFMEYWHGRLGDPGNSMADDSVALLGLDTYVERVLPMHRRWYEAIDNGQARRIHLCGDATRLFPVIQEQLNVRCFDTGFPVDHGQLRRQLGPDTTIQGGPEVALLLNGTADQVYRRAQEILQSGVMEGGRFILREGNNLPPNVPEDNLAAMYQACLDHGRYDQ
jgi:hypothetical protein